MTPADVSRIAEIVNLIRPAWSVPLIRAVLNDERMIRRPHTDALIAMSVLALDPTTDKPGRVHEQGPWWRAVQAVNGGTGTLSPLVREARPDDCSICNQPAGQCPPDHEPEPWNRPRAGAKPNDEQRALIEQARQASQAKREAEAEALAEQRARWAATGAGVKPDDEQAARLREVLDA